MISGYANLDCIDKLYSKITDCDFRWQLVSNITGDKNDGPGLVHPVVKDGEIQTTDDIVECVREVIDSISDINNVTRLKINCLLKNNIDYHNNFCHTDQSCDHNVMIIYLNDSDGDTMMYDDSGNVISKSSPEKGKYILFNGDIKHSSTRPVNNDYRFIINVNYEPDDEFIINEVKKIVLEKEHDSQTLFDHLYGTYQLLKKMGTSRYVRLAGLCHSIYGTISYKDASVSTEDRDKVKLLIGCKAEEISYNFSCIDRTPESFEQLEESMQLDLLLVEYANLIDQNFAGQLTSHINDVMSKIVNLRQRCSV